MKNLILPFLFSTFSSAAFAGTATVISHYGCGKAINAKTIKMTKYDAADLEGESIFKITNARIRLTNKFYCLQGEFLISPTGPSTVDVKSIAVATEAYSEQDF